MKFTAMLLGAAVAVVSVSANAAETVTYQYDELGRLKQVARSGSVNNGAQSAYALDPAGNRTGVAQQAATTDPGTDPNAAISLLCSLDLPAAIKAQLGCP